LLKSRPIARRTRQSGAARLCIEPLEDRSLPSFLGPVTPGQPTAVDFNNDGVLDLIASGENDNVNVFLGNRDGTFQAAVSFDAGGWVDAGPGPYSLAVGDFNSDGNLDVVTTFDWGMTLLLGDGHGNLGAPNTAGELAGNNGAVAAGDFNADGHPDLAVAFIVGPIGNVEGPYETYASILLGDGAGGFSPLTTVSLGELSSSGFPPTAVVADLNPDGMPDLLVLSSNYAAVSVILNDGQGGLLPPSTFVPAPYYGAMALGDLDGDGDLDLAATGYSSVDVMFSDGSGGFSAPQHSFAGSYGGPILLRDFNNDGKLDLALPQPGNGGDLTVALGIGNGTFSTARTFGGLRGEPVAGDFNGDGWLDLATAYAGDGVAVWINDHTWPPLDAPSIAIGDVTITEGNISTRAATFTVSLSAASTQPVTVAFTTADGTATAGSDYQAASGTLTFAPGETSKSITVLVNGDRVPEPNETFSVNLSSPTNAMIAKGQAVGTIVDDEPRISISDVTRTEGRRGQATLFTFTVTLSAAYDQPVTMTFRTVDGTATISDKDYIAKNGTLTFNPGETTKTITVVVNGDSRKEANETFYLDLFGNSSNSLFSKSRGAGTILNDD
jgi:hypothetical protein